MKCCAVIDTNVIVSGLLTKDKTAPTAIVLDALIDGKFTPLYHEGIVARALEKQGIVSDRCEMNRQIKADNALLRELKATVKKLVKAVKNTVPAIAETMEKWGECMTSRAASPS